MISSFFWNSFISSRTSSRMCSSIYHRICFDRPFRLFPTRRSFPNSYSAFLNAIFYG